MSNLRASGHPEIAVVGASGFVGQQVLRSLAEAGATVTALVRGSAELLERPNAGYAVAHPEQVGEFDVVINLAYPTSIHLVKQYAATRSIVNSVVGLVKPGGRVLHASTCAVFGAAVERKVAVGPVPLVRDSAYIETKILAEKLLADASATKPFSLDIVRLGNVTGPASPGWAAALVGRILCGRPVLVEGTPGLSNATDVRNVADYIRTVASGTAPSASRTSYHHLAEFSAAPWSRWLVPLADYLEVPLESAPLNTLSLPNNLREELRSALSQTRPRSIYRNLNSERRLGSLLRSALVRLPDETFRAARGIKVIVPPTADLTRSEQTFLSIMAGEHEFRTVAVSGWSPPVSLDRSVGDTLTWLAGN